jgi:hypothetical protein
VVFGEGGEVGRVAECADIAGNRGGEVVGVAAAAEVGVCADGADFAVAGRGDAVAGHGGKAILDFDAE